MSRGKAKRKHNNRLKRGENYTRGLKLECWDVWKNKDGTAQVRATDKWGRTVGVKMFDLANQAPRLWHVLILVKCLAPDGQKYIEEREFGPPVKLRLNDITDVYKAALQDALDSVNSNHIVDTGWIATAL